VATEAPRWILLPGTLCTGDVFAPLMQALRITAARQIVLALDAPDVLTYRARLVETLCHRDVVCGFSLGAIAAAHAADVLEQAAALVLIGLNPRADAAEKRPGREGLRAATHAGELADTFASAASALFAQPTPALLDQVITMARGEAGNIDAQTTLAITRPSAFPALQKCTVPVVFVTGAKDRQTPPDLAHEAAQAAPGSALRLVPGLGHFCLLEDPAAVAMAIRDGLDTLGVDAC
jgi:pimeloyl-ACP methyl ester carboxylesterase